MAIRDKIVCSRCRTVPEMIIKNARMWIQDGVSVHHLNRRPLCKKCFDEVYEEDVLYMISLREK